MYEFGYVSILDLFVYKREKARVIDMRARTSGTISSESDPDWNHNTSPKFLSYAKRKHKHKET